MSEGADRFGRSEVSGDVAATAFPGLGIGWSIKNERWLDDGLGDFGGLLSQIIGGAAARVGLSAAIETELGVILTDDAEVRGLNAEWRGKDMATNVLTFPLADLSPGQTPGPLLGDVVLARETVLREAASEDKAVKDHLCHLIVHGFLHCLGFDHVDADHGDAMEGLETAILADLGIGDPYGMTERDVVERPTRRVVDQIRAG